MVCVGQCQVRRPSRANLHVHTKDQNPTVCLGSRFTKPRPLSDSKEPVPNQPPNFTSSVTVSELFNLSVHLEDDSINNTIYFGVTVFTY